jgi:hypothetical protein
MGNSIQIKTSTVASSSGWQWHEEAPNEYKLWEYENTNHSTNSTMV